MNHHIFNKILGGFLLIGIGVLILLNQTGVIQIEIGSLISVYWPVILIYIGLHGMAQKGGIWNIFIFLLGGYLLLRNMDVEFIEDLNLWQFIVPILLIVGGLNMLTRGARYEERKAERKRQYREDREQRRQERDERRNRRHEERSRYKYAAPSSHTGTGAQPGQPQPPQSDDEVIPPFDPSYARKIEQELDKAFQERVLKKREDDDPFPLVSGMQKTAGDKQDSAFAGGTDFGAAAPKQEKSGESFGYAPPPPPPPPPQGHNWQAGWQHANNTHTVYRSNFIGDIYLGQDYWQLEPLDVSHFIGDTTIDLTKATIPYGETKVNVSAFIGDVKVFVPNDIQLEISVSASAFIGDMKVLDRHESGMFRNMKYDPVHYGEAEKKINLAISMFIGDVLVKRVG